MLAGGIGTFGGGATGVGDGVDTGGWVATPETDLGNWEVWELFVPQIFMSRMLDPYSVGYGRYRSGLAIPSMDMLHRFTEGIGSAAIGCGHDRIIPNIGLFGGYPGGKRNTFLVRYHNFEDMIAKRLPLIHETGDPREFKNQKYADVIHFDYTVGAVEVRDKDLTVSDNGSAGGLGDPIERDPALQKADLDTGLTNEKISRNVYCIEADYDQKAKEWKIDEDATKRLRAAKRKERLSRGVPVEEWWQKSRQRLLKKDMDPLLLEMYRSSMKLSQNFTREFKDFWGLPNDFAL